MKVTHTVFHIESDEEKRILAQALAKELIKNESVMGEEAGSHELPQYIQMMSHVSALILLAIL